MNPDFRDIIELLIEQDVQFVVVGAHALAVHGVARATGDIDFFVNPSTDNAQSVYRVLQKFGAPVEAHGVQAADFATAGTIYQIGLPPTRIDILTHIDGVSFEEAWRGHLSVETGGLSVPFLGKAEFVKNKRASGRPKDLLDIALLKEVES